MNSKAHAAFWESFENLPRDVQQTAREKYAFFLRNPSHPSLRFKLIRDDLWSVRINRDYRALGILQDQTIYWFWIGTHRDYDRLIK